MALFPTAGQSTSLVSQLQPRTNAPTETTSAVLPASVSTSRMTHIINGDAAILSAGFVDGTPIKGTYYRRLASPSHNRSTSVGSDRHDTSVYTSYIMIKDMEMRSLGAFSHEYNAERGTFSYSAEAVAYPGVIPLIGDIYLLSMEDTIAVFRVTNTVPMSWRNNAMTKVSMTWTEIYTPELHQTLNDSTTTILEFDLKTMLEYRSYLTEESVTKIYELKALKKSLAIFMRRHFYSQTLNTYLRYDGVYDSYVIRYMQMTQDASQYDRYAPNQINPLMTATQFEESIFGCMLGSCEFAYVTPTCYTSFFSPSTRSSVLTALVNTEYTKIGSGDLYSDYYIFPETFYSGVAVTPLELLIQEYLTTRQAPDPGAVLSVGQDIASWSDKNLQFYAVPLIVHMSTLAEIGTRKIGSPQL